MLLPVLLWEAAMSTGTLGSRALHRSVTFIGAPPLAPGRVIPFPRRARQHTGHDSEPVDSIIRRVWGLYCADAMTEAAADELHNRLIELRDGGLANPREEEARR
jgi:hypothetical protein